MRKAALVLRFWVLAMAFVTTACAQELRPWWVSFELGDGQLKLSSDQNQGNRGATLALGFAGGHRLGNRVRVGALVNGWLLQAFNLNNPAVGESVSNVMGVVDAFPLRNVPLFVRGGAGLGIYTNDRPEGNAGHGFAWTVGSGYQIPLTRQFALAPMIAYTRGHFGDVRNPIIVETGRRYSVVEFKVAVVWQFGRE